VRLDLHVRVSAKSRCGEAAKGEYRGIEKDRRRETEGIDGYLRRYDREGQGEKTEGRGIKEATKSTES